MTPSREAHFSDHLERWTSGGIESETDIDVAVLPQPARFLSSLRHVIR